MSSTIQRNKDLLHRTIQAYNNQDLDTFIQCHSSDVVLHGRTENIQGRDEVIAHQWGFFDSFSDSTITVDEMIAEGDTVALRYRTTATHDGPYGELLPTGKSIKMELIAIVRIADGRIVEKWIQADVQGLLQQLGVTSTSATSRSGQSE